MTKDARGRRNQDRSTPLRRALEDKSSLKPLVKNGLGAVKAAHRAHFDKTSRTLFADSLDIDEGLMRGHEQENRWDYILGHEPTRKIIAVEPHSADNSEIRTVIGKRQAASHQLRGHFREGTTISKWIWVASGKVRFLPMTKATILLAQNGIKFVGGTITSKHLE